MTVRPETAGMMSAGIAHLRTLVSAIHVEPDCGTPWPPEAIAVLAREYQAAADFYVLGVASGAPFRLSPLEKTILRLKGLKRPEAPCGAGRSLIAVDCDGILYPCHRFVGDRRFAAGDVDRGVDAEILKPFQAFRARFHARPQGRGGCAYCSAVMTCVGGCPAANVAATNDPRSIPPAWCQVQRIVAREALRALYLLTHDPDTAPRWDKYIAGKNAPAKANCC
jgi:uncharacterized protein